MASVSSIVRFCRDASATITSIVEARDVGGVEACYESWAATIANPRAVLAEADDRERAALCRYFEAWDDVAGRWFFAADDDSAIWQSVLAPHADGFLLPLLNMNAWWLREAGSTRVDDVPPLPQPADLSTMSLEAQARALGRFCSRADAGCPVAYDNVAGAIDVVLLPYFTSWFLTVFAQSPCLVLSGAMNDHRRDAAGRFARFHADRPVTVPRNLLLGAAGYRAAYFLDNPRDFLAALSNRVLHPSGESGPEVRSSTNGEAAVISRAGVAAPSEARAESAAGGAVGGATTGGVAVALTCWHESHPVYRCMAPPLERLRARGAIGLHLGTRHRVDVEVAADWRADPVELMSCAATNQGEIDAAADTIAARDLDLLFYPEVGLTNASRWLCNRRLARVQAAGFGHPVTTGADAVDYFVLGVELAHPASFHERLVLLPGLGVASTVPPAPSRPRTRPLDARAPVLVCLASRDKLHDELFEAWAAMLDGAPSGSRLMLLPGADADTMARVEARLSRMMPHVDVEVCPRMSRAQCIDIVNEADICLDSFPYGGYNSLLEVCACGCPILTLEGLSAPGRHGAALIRLLGLPDSLIAATIDEYVAAGRQLIDDIRLRLDIRDMLERERVVRVACNDEIAAHFAAAVDWMVAEGPCRGDRTPVYIEAGAAPREFRVTDRRRTALR